MQMLKKRGEQYRDNSYSDVIVLHINHCMDNSFYFSNILEQVFGEVVFVAAPYNNRQMETDDHDYTFYTAKINEQNYSIQRNNVALNIVKNSFGECINSMIEVSLERDIFPKLKDGKRLLIIEDGGYHYDIMRGLLKKNPSLKSQIVGTVEQTTSGTRRCYYDGVKNGFMYPCTSIARSELKMNFESIFIGQRIVEELNYFLYSANTFLNFQNVLIVGYGIIGRNVNKALQTIHCNVMAIDSDERICETARNDGLEARSKIDRTLFAPNTILIGCVGNPSFSFYDMMEFMLSDGENLYLASGSSKQVEFIDFIEGFKNAEEADIIKIELKTSERYFDVYNVTYKDITKKIYLIANGLPVNFYREDVISLTHRVIDLIFVEMLLIGISLVEDRYDNEMFLLGGDNKLKEIIDEKALIKEWFDTNGMNKNAEIYEMLDAHPDSDYLRGKFVKHEELYYK